MYCPRLDHFVRFNADGTVGKCGHMIGAPGFENWESMQSSQWLLDIRAKMEKDIWPQECQRCKDTEPSHSIRLFSIKKHAMLNKNPDYLILGGVLDNICNSACQSCNAGLSTKIGSLQSANYPRIDNGFLFDRVPMERVVEIDINGGEPTASPGYQKLLENLPPSTKILRVNTNGSRMLPNIQNILDQDIKLIVTLSLDGIGRTHDYVRWPVRWANYERTVNKYLLLRSQHTNLELQTWTTLHALNVADFSNIKNYSQSHDINHSWAYLENPSALNLRYQNSFSQPAKDLDPGFIATEQNNQQDIDDFIARQDKLRNINIRDYL